MKFLILLSTDSKGDKSKHGKKMLTVFNPEKSLWHPGQLCPVHGCGIAIHHHYNKFARHWRERHMAVVSKFVCPLCGASSKRRECFRQHMIVKHEETLDSFIQRGNELLEIEEFNNQYIDPQRLTLEIIFGQDQNKKC